jgi:DNA-binding response OmpR family regulator
MRANVVCYLTKPFEAEELLNCVRRAIHGREIDNP